MPCTFSHPLAAALLHRAAPARLDLAALVIGSMAPDFGYYTGQFSTARFAHTIPGTILVCWPTGLLALAIFYLLRRPFCFLLPQPHRGLLLPLISSSKPLNGRRLCSIAASLLLGTWTHTVWDSFTHDGAWIVERLPFLQTTVMSIGESHLTTAYLLQQTSTLAGGALLLFLYIRWMKKQSIRLVSDGSSERWRYMLLCSLIATSLVIATPAALQKASFYEGYTAMRVFVFRTAIYASAAFFLLTTLSCFCLLKLGKVYVPTHKP